jgi:hypothetical protein
MTTITDTNTSTHTIYAYLLDTLRTRVERANKRAARLKIDGYTLTVTPTDPEPVYDEDRIARWHRDEDGNSDYPIDSDGRKMEPEYYRERVTATIGGVTPKLPGEWEFIGLVELDSQIGPMPKLLTDEARALDINLDAYRDSDDWNTCDHCHTTRDRAKVYLLRSSITGAIVRVGSSCVAAFLGLTVRIPEPAIGGILEGIDELEEMPWYGGPDDYAFRIDHVLAVTHGMIAKYGWLSSTNARYTPGATSTGERVSLLMKGKGLPAELERHEMIDSVPVKLLADMVTYARDLRDHDDSEYARTISAIVRGTHEGHCLVSGRNVKMLASVVSGYQRAKAREAELAAAADSDYVGEVKKRGLFAGLRVLFSRTFDGYYGERQLVKFVDSEGNILVWWNTGSADPKVGETYDVTATVKGHEEYEGVRQTTLTRCKLVAS